MRWLFRKTASPPTVRELHIIVPRAMLIGGTIGMAANGVIHLLTKQPYSEFWKEAGQSFYVAGIFAVCFTLCCGLPWTYLRPVVREYPTQIRYVIVGLVGALGAMVAYTMSSYLVRPVLPRIPVIGMDGFGPTLFGEAVIGAGIALLIGTIKGLRAQIREKELRESMLAEAAAKAQAFALQAQINPHFFFNTLNTLNALIPVDPEAAQEVVGQLADMFRYTLACSRAERVTLTQELAFVENYLKLEKARFSRRLQVTLPEGEFADIHLPGLSLQPLVENAIRYGIAKRIEGGKVEIAVQRNGKQCSVDVFSPVDTESEPAQFFREGHALANVRERLRLYAGDVSLARESENRLRVSLVLAL